MWQDPFTLIVALNKEGAAKGQLYLDDGVGYDYEKGDFVWRQYDFTSTGKAGTLRSTDRAGKTTSGIADLATYDPIGNEWAKAISHVKIERIVVLGLSGRPASVTAAGRSVKWTYEDGAASSGRREGKAGTLVVKSPGIGVVEDWEVDILA